MVAFSSLHLPFFFFFLFFFFLVFFCSPFSVSFLSVLCSVPSEERESLFRCLFSFRSSLWRASVHHFSYLSLAPLRRSCQPENTFNTPADISCLPQEIVNKTAHRLKTEDLQNLQLCSRVYRGICAKTLLEDWKKCTGSSRGCTRHV